ncbi:hypothetical protein ACIQW5_26015 [Methylorubrum thiocyanatum]|uniref:hypothetical protein n=1 Tax=Methylorubrum thiocyanatum TaxID=47958 RepID=UPI00383A64F4
MTWPRETWNLPDGVSPADLTPAEYASWRMDRHEALLEERAEEERERLRTEGNRRQRRAAAAKARRRA